VALNLFNLVSRKLNPARIMARDFTRFIARGCSIRSRVNRIRDYSFRLFLSSRVVRRRTSSSEARTPHAAVQIAKRSSGENHRADRYSEQEASIAETALGCDASEQNFTSRRVQRDRRRNEPTSERIRSSASFRDDLIIGRQTSTVEGSIGITPRREIAEKESARSR